MPLPVLRRIYVYDLTQAKTSISMVDEQQSISRVAEMLQWFQCVARHDPRSQMSYSLPEDAEQTRFADETRRNKRVLCSPRPRPCYGWKTLPSETQGHGLLPLLLLCKTQSLRKMDRKTEMYRWSSFMKLRVFSRFFSTKKIQILILILYYMICIFGNTTTRIGWGKEIPAYLIGLSLM